MKILLLYLVGAVSFAQAIDWINLKPKQLNPSFLDAGLNASYPQGRIAGGQEATPGQFPSLAALLPEFSSGTLFCGGTLASQNYILTAAHCVVGALSLGVILGAHNIRESETSQVYVSGTSYYAHEYYDSTTYNNDIALVRLSQTITLTDRIQLATLPSYSDTSNSYTGSSALAVGWGQTSDSSTEISSVLRYVQSSIISNSACDTSYPGVIQDNQLCLDTTGGKSTCSGDSGGPLLVGSKQVAITSYGITLGCEFGWPTVFTRLTSYLSWIAARSDIQISS